jgi:hypothetical protein
LDDVEKAAPNAYELLRRFWTDVDSATTSSSFRLPNGKVPARQAGPTARLDPRLLSSHFPPNPSENFIGLPANPIVPLDHVVKSFEVEFFAPHLRIVAVSSDCVLDDPTDDPVGDYDLIACRGPTAVALVDHCLVIAQVALDVGTGAVRRPNPNRDAAVIAGSTPAVLDGADNDLPTSLLTAHLRFAASGGKTTHAVILATRPIDHAFCAVRADSATPGFADFVVQEASASASAMMMVCRGLRRGV